MRKEFDEIKNEINTEVREYLEKYKKENNRKVFIFVCIIFFIGVIFILFKAVFLGIFMFLCSVIAFLYFFDISRKMYSREYKRCIITKLVNGYDKNLSYSPTGGIPIQEYKIAGFDKEFQKYKMEDKIYGDLNGKYKTEICELTTFAYEYIKDSNGVPQKTEVQTFKGLVGYVKLSKPLGFEFKINPDNILRRYDKDRIEVDSAEFEKIFDLNSTDKVKSMEIFTSNVISKYVDIMCINGYALEVKAIGDKLYFRYKCGDVFEAPIFNSGLNDVHLAKIYKLIYYPLEVLLTTVQSIEEING